VRLLSRKRVALGRGVTVGRGVRFDVARGGRVTVGDGATLAAGCRLHVHDGAQVVIGEQARLGERCAIVAHERVTIGARARLADEVVLTDCEHVAADPERPIREQGIATAPVDVGDDAVLDRGVCLLPGAQVADGARVTTHAVVGDEAQPAASPTGQLTPVPPRPQ
jgi:acetyltransferase-like isoleucine patch superfamily enzyme